MENSGDLNQKDTQFLDENEVKAESKNKLRILLVSDIHLAMSKMRLLLNWYEENGKKRFDYVFGSGDFGNINHNKEGGVDETESSKAEADITEVLYELEKFTAPIYYIPGNHDPESFFAGMDKRPTLTINS